MGPRASCGRFHERGPAGGLTSKFLCSTEAPFLRPDLPSQRRRAQTPSRMVAAPLPPRTLPSPDHALTAASTTSSWSTAGTLQSSLALMVATGLLSSDERRDDREYLLKSQLLPALAERAQAQRIELDEAGGVAVVVGNRAFLEGDEVLVVQRKFALAPDHDDIALVEF
jgi:hypothetical protein